jgi:hypothetical protein
MNKIKKIILIVIGLATIIPLCLFQTTVYNYSDSSYFNVRAYVSSPKWNGTTFSPTVEPIFTKINIYEITIYPNGTVKPTILDYLKEYEFGWILNYTTGSWYWHRWYSSPVITAWLPFTWQYHEETITLSEGITIIMEEP